MDLPVTWPRTDPTLRHRAETNGRFCLQHQRWPVRSVKFCFVVNFFLTDNFRYHEQKFRLKKCGIDNKIYLIESHVNYGLPLSNLRQAATNTAIQDNFHVKFTETPSSTVRYLTELTRTLHELFQVSWHRLCQIPCHMSDLQSKTLIGCHERPEVIDVNRERVPLMTFAEFNRASVKNKVSCVKMRLWSVKVPLF